MSLTIYHNPRCSKSRQTLAIIENAGHTPKIIKYLDHPVDVQTLKTLQTHLGFESARDFMRTGETVYKDLDLKSVTDEDALLAAMAEHPKLMERPIVDNGTTAILGRPPENVTALL